MSNKHNPAFPTEIINSNDNGLSKFEYATIHLMAALLSNEQFRMKCIADAKLNKDWTNLDLDQCIAKEAINQTSILFNLIPS